jgi:hypothetical protein
MNQDDLKKAAETTYLALKTVFSQSNYWRLGQTFDTIIDYFLVMNQDDGEAAVFGTLALDKYATTHGSWYDDYAWWGQPNQRQRRWRHGNLDQRFGDPGRCSGDCLNFLLR